MTKLFKPLISLFRTWKKTGNLSFAYRLLPEVYSPDIHTSIHKKGNEAIFKGYKKSFSKSQVDLFGNHGELLLKFIKANSISFDIRSESNEIATINMNEKTIRMNVVNYDNLKVIEEIFIDQLYDFHTKENYVVFDVGMNVACSVLYFASFDNVEKVYSYEPFLKTYECALENISLNKELAGKIETFNYGLGDKDEWVEVPLPADNFLGGSTTKEFIDELPDELKKKSIKVEVRSIIAEVKKIKQDNPGKKFLLKLDCEGAEYGIMKELENHNMVNDFDVFMIEFHYKGKKELADILNNNSFYFMSPCSDEVNTFGMLYAVKLCS
jgi:FkbM family methyltransferase